ncbi:branched-chain amino acid ABC transporter permease [Tropicimonas sediminicola]|uniref:Amino acid/amide ABC transporter membrane protein 2, HAAT family n=1 Tax=Tropicimonas sediminicola TaxID=1031541 RepID=A0A239JW25_9RHOB|nr:branched-chain amino acid ABC transporter permease [Tropicimonas sediminicola]SNT09960.1 amino acid/amide ABC transporter membrane protein 2, HAAT family [Tropicimonas sediminicola]
MIRERYLNLALLAALLAVPVLAQVQGAPFTITLATKIAIFALAAVGLNLALGLGGLVSFGHAAFFGVGGYVIGILASHARNYEPFLTWPVEVAGTTQMLVLWPLAVLVAALVAAAIGALSLRTSGIFFIMITLAFAQMLYYFAVSWPTYGGEDGLPFYLRGDFPGLNTMDPISFFGLCYALLLVALWLFHRLHRARFGLALEGARQNPERVQALGIRPFQVRLLAFILSGAITGLAGALYADLNRFVSPAMLGWQTSGELIVLIILGGVGRLCGPVAGAGLFFLLEHWLGGLSEFWQFWFGLILLCVVLFARGGLIGALAKDQTHD